MARGMCPTKLAQMVNPMGLTLSKGPKDSRICAAHCTKRLHHFKTRPFSAMGKLSYSSTGKQESSGYLTRPHHGFSLVFALLSKVGPSPGYTKHDMFRSCSLRQPKRLKPFWRPPELRPIQASHRKPAPRRSFSPSEVSSFGESS